MTIYTITYNEAFMLPHFIAHYRKAFPDCTIVVYDNESTDDTVKIALAHGCQVIPYSTSGQLDDRTYLSIKNNCWKGQKGWVIVCDCDELCDINAEDLAAELEKGTTIISFTGYNMVNLEDNLDFSNIKHGIRTHSYDKNYCFFVPKVVEIGYNMGCHTSNPIGEAVFSYQKYVCRHYKYVNPDYMVNRHNAFAKRMSDENLAKGYGGHYLNSEQDIRNEFQIARLKALKIIL